jgi:heat shock protein HslJ
MTEAEPRGPNATSDALAGTEWSMVRLDGTDLTTAGEPLLLAFGHDGRVWGTTGVNEVTASYSLTESYLTFGPLATTRRGGAPELMEQEHRIIASLAGMCPFHLTTHTLSIDGPLGRLDLVSTAPLPGPIGAGPGQGATAAPPTREPPAGG